MKAKVVQDEHSLLETGSSREGERVTHSEIKMTRNMRWNIFTLSSLQCKRKESKKR